MKTTSSSKNKYVVAALLVATTAISIALSVFLIYHWEYVSRFENHGYLGLFLIALLAGSPIPIPTPSMILTFTFGSLSNPVLVGIVSGLGNAIGTTLIYLSGRGGSRFFSDVSVSDSQIGRFLGKMRIPRMLGSTNRMGVAVLLLSIYPNPVLTPVVLGMGATRFSFTKFSIACWAGKTVQAMVLAYLGYFGLHSLLHFLGVFNAY